MWDVINVIKQNFDEEMYFFYLVCPFSVNNLQR